MSADQRFAFYKTCTTSGWVSKKLCRGREFNSVCLEVQGIRLVQDKGDYVGFVRLPSSHGTAADGKVRKDLVFILNGSC